MLQNIPTHLIAGPLGAGKTSLIHNLMAQRPPTERWAILINEFGQIGLDTALLNTSMQESLSFSEVAGGCLCCVNGAPFQVGLGRLLRKARPDRLFIEPSGLGHPAQLRKQLSSPPWEGVLDVEPMVMVLDAAELAAGRPLPEPQALAIVHARLLLLNKSENLKKDARARVSQQLPAIPLQWTTRGQLSLQDLPGYRHSQTVDKSVVDKLAMLPGLGSLPAVWLSPETPICLENSQSEGWSIGWRWHPAQAFELMKLQAWLAELPWRRAKIVIHSNAGWLSGNALNGEPVHWQSSEWRNDSRLELIFDSEQHSPVLQAGLAACLIF